MHPSAHETWLVLTNGNKLALLQMPLVPLNLSMALIPCGMTSQLSWRQSYCYGSIGSLADSPGPTSKDGGHLVDGTVSRPGLLLLKIIKF